MSRRTYLTAISFVFIFASFLIYVYLRRFPSLIFYTDLNAYIFFDLLLLDYPYLLIIIAHPILLFVAIFIEDKKGSDYLSIQRRYAWIFMAVLVKTLIWGYLFYGIDGSTTLMEFSTWDVDRFIFGNINSPLLYVAIMFLLALAQSSFNIDLYFVVRKVTGTWWLQIPLVISLWLSFMWLIPHLIWLVIPSFPEQIVFIVPSLYKPIWITFVYFFVLKGFAVLIIKPK